MADANVFQTTGEQTAFEDWAPSERCRRWLLIGTVALLVDLVLGIWATVLEFRHWGQEGVTPEFFVDYASIVPQTFVMLAYLVLARDVGARNLWKSMAGMFGVYLLMCLMGLIFWEAIPEAGTTAVLIAAAVGIVAMVVFSISGVPRFANNADEALGATKPSDKPSGWVYFVAFALLTILRRVVKRFVAPWFADGIIPEDWAVFEFVVLAAFGMSYAIWFSVAKIKLRNQLGGMSCLVGVAEISILVIHLGFGVLVFFSLMSEAAAQPELDDAGIDQLFDPWIKRGSLMTTACHAAWCILTIALFQSLRGRSNGEPAEINQASL